LAGLANFILALSLPAPWNATSSQRATLVLFGICLILCAVAFFRLKGRPASGRRWAVGGGVLGLLLILWRGGPLLFLMLTQGTTVQALSALFPVCTWMAQVLAAALLLGTVGSSLQSEAVG
jgi:hypothetical protein